MKRSLEDAKTVVDIFRGKDALNNALVLYSLGSEGPGISQGISKRNYLPPQCTVYRRLEDLKKQGYVERVKDPARKGDKGKYYLTALGLCVCSFLDMPDYSLAKAMYTDGQIVTTIRDDKAFRFQAPGHLWMGFELPSGLPLATKLQLDYVENRLLTNFMKTKWAKGHLKVLERAISQRPSERADES